MADGTAPRPLLPAPVGHRKAPQPPPKRSRILTACEPCRTRKTRCNGALPQCHECAIRRTLCSYPATENRVTKRKYGELQQRESTFREVFALLTTMPEQVALDMLQRLRAGGDPENILSLVRDGSLLMQLVPVPETRHRYEFPYVREMPASLLKPTNPYIRTLVYDYTLAENFDSSSESEKAVTKLGAYHSLYSTPYHALQIVEPRLDTITPSSWTLVCSDNALMRKLLKSFFLTEYYATPFFQKEYFLADMAAGRRRFCSPLLVNIVLAHACHSDRENPHRAEFWNPRNLAYQFLAEARRLWELEASKPKLTTVQATLIIHMVYALNGSDELGYRYSKQAVEMADCIGLFKPSTTLSQKMQNARDYTAWALYAWQGLIAYMLQRPPLINEPPKVPLPRSSENPDWYGETWCILPSIKTPFPLHLGQYIESKVQLCAIASDISSQIGNNELYQTQLVVELSPEQVLTFCAKLDQWYANLPVSLKVARIVTPYQLQLHMQYQNYMIHLLEEPMTTRLEEPMYAKVVAQTLSQQPREMLSRAKASFETLIRLYYLRHGFEALDSFMIQYLSLLANVAHNTLQNSSQDALKRSLRSTIVLAATGLRDQGRYHYLGQMVFTAVRGTMASKEIELIDRFTIQGRVNERHPPEDWSAASTWSMDFGRISDDREARKLTKLLEKARISEAGDADGAQRSTSRGDETSPSTDESADDE